MTSYFLLEVTDSELTDILKTGSTNQKNFINKAINNHAVTEVFDLLESLITGWSGQEPFDIRGAINGGMLFLTNAVGVKELSDNDFIKYEIKDDLFLVIE